MQSLSCNSSWRKIKNFLQQSAPGFFMLQTMLLGIIVLMLAEMMIFYYVIGRKRLQSEAITTAIFLAEKRFALFEDGELVAQNGSEKIEKNNFSFEVEYTLSLYEENVYKGEIIIVWNKGQKSEGKRVFERLFLKDN